MSTSQGEYARCFSPVDTIVDSGRVLRRPIKEWSSQLLAVIRSCSGKRPWTETIVRGCTALNNAALLFAHAGRPEVAEGICQSQLDWLDRLRSVLSETELSVMAIQPWVNLGRLYRRSCDYDRALSYFHALDTTRYGATARFGVWDVPLSDAFREAAEPIYVYENLRTHLQSGDLDRAIHFANGFDRPLLKSSLMLKTELLIHVFLRQGEPYQFLPLIKEMPWPEERFGVLAKHFYTSLALNAIQQPESCVRALDRLAPHFISHVSRPDVDSRDLRFAIEVCRLAGHLGLHEVLESILSAACAAVLRAQDVPFASQLLLLGKQHGCDGTREELSAVEEFAMHSSYNTSLFKTMSPAASETLAELRYSISQLFCEPVSGLCA
jgi:hypothetical protein